MGLAAHATGIGGSTAVVDLVHRQADGTGAVDSGDAGGSPAEASGSGPAGGEGTEQVTDSAEVAKQQGLDPAETADASI